MTPTVELPNLLTLEDVANYLGVSKQTARKYVAQMRIRQIRVNARSIRYSAVDLDKALRKRSGR